MQVERGSFLLLVSSLAAGGAAGYLLSEKDVVPHLGDSAHNPKPVSMVQIPDSPAALQATPAGHTELTSAEATKNAKPACDDAIGEPDACPPIGLPMEEGGCGALAHQRCEDFKKTMKPRVAAAAVACLKKLGGAACDPKRIELCAHNALMNACDDSSAPSVTQSCDAISTTCGSSVSKQECTMAMSGLRETGREVVTDCAKKHCNDKGILGCESIGPNAKP